jgi:hypothetical protein
MTVAGGFSVRGYAEMADGISYMSMARVLAGYSPASITEYDHRVFPGLPGLLSLAVLLRMPLEWAALGLSWSCSGLSAVFSAMLCKDRRMGWAVATLTPQWVMNGSMIMSEALMLALMLGGLLLARSNWGVAGGLVAGAAGLTRPMTGFAVIAQQFSDYRSGHQRRALMFGAAAALTVVAGVAIVQWRTGDALEGARLYATHPRAYAGQLLDWPFHAFLVTAFWTDMVFTRFLYVMIHLPLVLFACIRLATRWRRAIERDDSLLAMMTLWLLGNTLFVACIGSRFAFHIYPRFILAALPPLLWAYLPELPRTRFGWMLCAIMSYLVAVTIFTRV